MDDVTEVRPGVHLVHGGDVNRVILTQGDAVTRGCAGCRTCRPRP